MITIVMMAHVKNIPTGCTQRGDFGVEAQQNKTC